MTSKLKKMFPKMKEEFMFTKPIMRNNNKSYTTIEIIPSNISEDNMMESTNSKLPQAIIFDPIPLPVGGYTTIANLYTHIVNPLYMGGQCNPTTETEVLAILNTMEYTFLNRVEYFVIVLLQSCIYKMKDRFRDINELELYNRIMCRIDSEFGNSIYYLKSYVGEDAIVTKETIPHMIISIDAMIYNCLLDALLGYPLVLEDYDFITSLMCEFDMVICDYFNDYILREVETIYQPQLETAIENGIKFNELEAKNIQF